MCMGRRRGAVRSTATVCIRAKQEAVDASLGEGPSPRRAGPSVQFVLNLSLAWTGIEGPSPGPARAVRSFIRPLKAPCRPSSHAPDKGYPLAAHTPAATPVLSPHGTLVREFHFYSFLGLYINSCVAAPTAHGQGPGLSPTRRLSICGHDPGQPLRLLHTTLELRVSILHRPLRQLYIH